MKCSTLKEKIKQLLLWSEKYTKTDMVYLTKGTFWIGIQQIFLIGSSLLLSVLYARFIPKETFGSLKYLLSIIGILLLSSLPGVNAALTRAVAKGSDGTIFPAMKEKLLFGLLGSVSGTVIALYYLVNGNRTFAISLFCIVIILPFLNSLSVYLAFLAGKKLFSLSSKFTIIRQTVSLFIMAPLVYFFPTSLTLLLLGIYLPQLIVDIVLTVRTIHRYKENDIVDTTSVQYGKHLSIISIFNAVSRNVDKIIIFHLLGPGTLALYVFALLPAESIKNAMKSLVPLILPKFSERSSQDIERGISQKVWLSLVIPSAILIIYVLIAPVVYPYFFPSYEDVTGLSMAAMLSIIIHPTTLLLYQFFIAQQKKLPLYFFDILTSLIRVFSVFFLTLFFGISGAVWSYSFTYIIGAGILLFLFRNYKYYHFLNQ